MINVSRDQNVTHSFALMLLGERKLGNQLSDERIRKNRSIARKYQPVDWLQRRVELSELLDEFQQDGKVPVYRWGRDCDQCESDSVTLIPATVVAYTSFLNRELRYAEGPVQVYPISFEDYAEFEPSFRDRRAEQYNY
jgi:hypothetical protein